MCLNNTNQFNLSKSTNLKNFFKDDLTLVKKHLNCFSLFNNRALEGFVHIINNDTYKNFANDNYLYEDFYNYEIIWNRQNIYFPICLDKSIQEFLNNKNRYFIISIGINLAEGAHANILIFDKLYKSYERYEPHGSRSLSNFYYFPNELDTYIYNYFSKFTDYTYIKPIDGSPAIGFQTWLP